jgi:Xaa-Pro aminopeptidase
MPNNADDVMVLPKTTTYFICQESIKMKPFCSLPRCFQRRKQSDFVCKEVNEQSKIWDGDFLTKEEVSTISGVKNVKWTHEMEKTHSFAFEADTFIWDIMSM